MLITSALQLTDEFFHREMIDHYQKLFRRYRKQWKFKRSFLAWQQLQHHKTKYQEQMKAYMNNTAFQNLQNAFDASRAIALN